MKFEGLYTPVITPHKDDLGIDHDGVAAMIEHLIDTGIHGLIVGGTTGEYYAQSAEERVALMRFFKERIAGRVPLMAGVGALRTEEAVEFARAARDTGVDAILVNSPYYAVPTQRELAEHALAIDREARLPIMLYNYPGRTGAMMQREFFDRVSTSSNFAGIKESSGDINQLHMLANDYTDIQLSCGADDQALEFFAWGATSWVAAGSNFLAREHIALYEACVLENDFRKGRRIMAALLPFMSLLEQGGQLIQCVKHGCALSGLPAGGVRKPIGPLDEQQKQQVADVVATLRTTVDGILSESGREPGIAVG